MNWGLIKYKIENKIYYTPDKVDDFINEIGDNFNLIRTNKKIDYYNIPCAFDIETSSFKIKGEKASLMYEWTLGINWVVMVGRTWDELKNCLLKVVEYFQLTPSRRLIIYVHNLGFEFQAFRKHFEWEKIFSLDKRKPIQAIEENGIEFRCSYMLSGYSLKKIGENLTKYKVEKKAGDLDYNLIRHSKTPLTDKEIGYCLNDVYVVMAYIQETIERCKDITRIPLTKTGFVRKYCRNSCLYVGNTHKNGVDKYLAYRRLMNELRLTPQEYKMLRRAFMGGFTHANPYFSRGVFKNVSSYDFTSSYPAIMLSEKFPMSKGEFIDLKSEEEFKNNLLNYCCVFDISFTNLKPKHDFENYLSVSHCSKLKKCVENNGRIVSAEYLETTITELDYFIINTFYTWDSCTIGTFVRYRKGYLPTDFIKAVLKLYIDKTELKGVAGKEEEYMSSKENVNSTFGMCVTDICRDEIVYSNDEWGKSEVNIDDAINKYNNSTKRFLSYAWGIYITAYGRYNLFTGIYEFGEDYIYSDTDSLKVVNIEQHSKYFEEYNERLNYKLEKAMKYHGIPIEMTRPKNKYGVEKPIGIWDFEGTYDKFKTLGAKRYLTQKDGEISLTVSGLNKKVAVPYLLEKYGEERIFDVFDDSLYIPAEYTGKMVHTYIDDEISGTVTDYLGKRLKFKELSGTHLEPCEYELSLSQKYIEYILGLEEEFD